jgi:ubiquinone/menaquinone biosynthesis C-methylase UbiE
VSSTRAVAGRRQSAGRRERAAPREWWASYFDANYLREFAPVFSAQRDRREVARLIEVLELPVGARVLDVPCGQGRHAHLLAESGFRVDGLDYSEALLKQARKRGEGPGLQYRQGDMRRLPGRWTGRFDAVVNLFTSFGFFDDPNDDARFVGEIARVLRPGGTLVWHGASRDGIMARFLTRDWWEPEQGTTVGQEKSFDPLSGILTTETTLRTRTRTMRRTARIRLYSATSLAGLLRREGLVVVGAYDEWTRRPLDRRSTEMLLVARKETRVSIARL